MQCPNCGHWNEAGSRFCEECGLELPPSTGAVSAYQVPVRATTAKPTGDVPDSVDFSEFVDDDKKVPAPPPQQLTLVDDPAPAPYAGPRLLLKSTGSIFKLGEATVIGRENPALQIDLEGYPDGKFISHRHAQVVRMNGKYYVEDLGSANHTYVNDKKLAQGQAEPLNEGDTLKLGKLELEFHDA